MIVFPGQRLAPSSSGASSTGVYDRAEDTFKYASLCGELKVTTTSTTASPSAPSKRTTVYGVKVSNDRKVIPQVNDIIMGKVVKISNRVASVQILIANELPCVAGHTGIIRAQDISPAPSSAAGSASGSTDGKLVIYINFRPGDIVKAQVVALGEGSTYYLSTNKLELGVIFAKSSLTGTMMVPLSPNEMTCLDSDQIERRKVAIIPASGNP